MEYMKIKDLLKMHMTNKGFSHRKLALKTGMSKSYITNIIGTKEDPGSIDAIKKIISALELTESEKIDVWKSWLYSKGNSEFLFYVEGLEKKIKLLEK